MPCVRCVHAVVSLFTVEVIRCAWDYAAGTSTLVMHAIGASAEPRRTAPPEAMCWAWPTKNAGVRLRAELDDEDPLHREGSLARHQGKAPRQSNKG